MTSPRPIPTPHELPKVGPENRRTFMLRDRPAEKARRVPCGPHNCRYHRDGFVVRLAATDAARLHHVRSDRSRRHVELAPDGEVVVFRFEAGQQCYGEHWDHTDTLYLVRGGDWRGNPRGDGRAHVRAADWVEDMSEQLDRVITDRTRG